MSNSLPIQRNVSSSNRVFDGQNINLYSNFAEFSPDLLGNFPERAVLHIVPSSPNPTSVPSIIHNLSEDNLAHQQQNVAALLAESQMHNAVENISDIDLNFLNETIIAASMNQEATVADEVLRNSFQNNLDKSQNSNERFVTIDVSQPIRLEQNSLIMVNGQKCVLQQNTETGQVLAFPIKEQDKPSRKRGRPRKVVVEEPVEATALSNSPIPEPISDDEKQNGIIEVLNKDGSLVRRSSRKKRRAKTLKGYETGNLRFELGSDAEESDSFDDSDLSSRRKRGPKPNKFANGLQQYPGGKRPRGRPRSLVPDATQAFLVQTGDGQRLMLEIPLSVIPSGVTLKEVAEHIASTLNSGVHQTTDSKLTIDISKLQTMRNSENAPALSEPVVQDDAVGSTTNNLNQIEQGISSAPINSLSSVDCVQPISEKCVEALSLDDEVKTSSEDIGVEKISRILEDSAQFGFHVPTSTNENFPTLSDKTNLINKTLLFSDTELTSTASELQLSELCENISTNSKPVIDVKAEGHLVVESFLNLEESNPGHGAETDHHSILKSIRHDHNLFSQPPMELSELLEQGVETVASNFASTETIVADLNSNPLVINFPTASATSSVSRVTPMVLDATLQCKVCLKKHVTESELIEHFKAEHPTKFCAECNFMSTHMYAMRRHAMRHSLPSVCSQCGKNYKDQYSLKMHIKFVHMPAEEMYQCDKCNKEFTRKAHLKRHARIHEPIKAYKCLHCDYRGCEKSDVSKHMVVHETPKHVCQICGKTFRHIKNHALHIKRHYRQRDFKCGICDFFGYTFTEIRKHIERRHSNKKLPICTECGTTFKSSDEMEEHKKNKPCVNSEVKQPMTGVSVHETSSTTAPMDGKNFISAHSNPMIANSVENCEQDLGTDFESDCIISASWDRHKVYTLVIQ